MVEYVKTDDPADQEPDHHKKDESTEQRILEAARRVFLEEGMAGARMQDIADRAGINKALLHYYFRSKEKLFDMIFREAALRFMPRVSVLFEADIPLFDKIRTFTAAYIEMLIENPFLPVFMISEMHRQDPASFLEKIWQGKRPAVDRFMTQVQEEIRQGIIKPIQPVHLMVNLMSMCIFPFAAKPMAQLVWNMSDPQFFALMEERKTIVAEFIIDSIRK